jgi:hypothetical protein
MCSAHIRTAPAPDIGFPSVASAARRSALPSKIARCRLGAALGVNLAALCSSRRRNAPSGRLGSDAGRAERSFRSRIGWSASVQCVKRVSHPIRSLREAQLNRLNICQVRGYCGPFINQEVYDSFPDPIWRGSAECVVCCDTRNVAEEEAKCARMMAGPAIISPARDLSEVAISPLDSPAKTGSSEAAPPDETASERN